MSKILLALTSIIFIGTANAQTFKVTKIQGKKAIVEVNDPNLISTGMTYDVGGGSSKSSGKGTGKRDNAIAIEAGEISSIGSPSRTNIEFRGSYLWNMKSWEAGPIVGMKSVSPGNTSTTTFGAFGYYNLNENKPGVETVLSALGSVRILSGSGSSTTTIDLGGNYRWFLLSSDHCFSFSGVYRINQYSGSSESGFVLNAGIATYF